MILPNVVIAGAPRCGTSSLFRYLAAHPDVLASRNKETCYFVDRSSALFDPTSNFLEQGLAGYAAHFDQPETSRTTVSVVLEATPGYMYQQLALHELPNIPTKPMFVFLLRNPMHQVRSNYLYARNQAGNLDIDVSFDDFVRAVPVLQKSNNEFHRRAVSLAEYVDHLEKWEASCGRDRMLILLQEDMARDPRRFMKEIAAQLGISPGFYDDYQFTVYNAGGRIRSRLWHGAARRIGPRLRNGGLRSGLRGLYRGLNVGPREQPIAQERQVFDFLEAHFAPFNQRLVSRFGVDLTPWDHRRECAGGDAT